MTMMFAARHPNANRSSWRSLVLWLWVGCFVFSFAARDCFHPPTCPEQALLKWAAHTGSSQTVLGASSVHSAGDAAECAACAVAGVVLALVTASAALVLWLRFALLEVRESHLRPRFSPALSIARGPPGLF